MRTHEKAKTLDLFHPNAPMEAVEFLAALLIVSTLPGNRSGKELSNECEDEMSFKETLTTQDAEFGNYFNIGGMWIDKDFLLKHWS